MEIIIDTYGEFLDLVRHQIKQRLKTETEEDILLSLKKERIRWTEELVEITPDALTDYYLSVMVLCYDLSEEYDEDLIICELCHNLVENFYESKEKQLSADAFIWGMLNTKIDYR